MRRHDLLPVWRRTPQLLDAVREVAVRDVRARAGAELATQLRLEEHLPYRPRTVVVAGRRRCVLRVPRSLRVGRSGFRLVVVPESVIFFGRPNGLVAGAGGGPVFAAGDYLNHVAVSVVIHYCQNAHKIVLFWVEMKILENPNEFGAESEDFWEI